jgi:hypothetical protein
MASRALGVLTVDLVARTGGFTAGLSKADRESQKFAKNLNRNADLLGKAFGAAFVGATALIIKNTIDASREQAQLAAVLKSTAGAAGQTQKELNAAADSLQQVSTFAAGSITEMQSLLLTFTKIQGDVFPKAQQAVLDMATALGMDLKGAALQLGKALNDPIKGVTALGRAGVQFSEDQKELIKTLVETGEVAKAQELILAELEVQFGGSAKAASGTLGGALIVLKNNFNDLLEGDSGGAGVKGATEAIQELSAVMAAPETKQAFATIINGVASVTAELAKGIAIWVNWIAKVNEMRGLATGGTILDTAPYDKINDRVGQITERINRLNQTTDTQAMWNPVTFLSLAAGEDAGAEQARMDAGGFNPYSRSDELEFLLRERERLIREGTERIRTDIANASGGSSGSPNGRGRGVSAPGEIISEDAQKTIDKLKEEAAAYGLTRSAVLELEKAKALSAATNNAERKAITESYDALISKVKAEEAATASTKAQTEAQKEFDRLQKDGERSQADLTRSIEQNAATMAGPAAQAARAYADELLRLTMEQEKLAAANLLNADTERELAIARQQAADQYQQQLTELEEKRTEAARNVLADLQFELELLGKTNLEREKAIALRYANVDAASAEGQAIAAAIDELDQAAQVAEGLDVVRQSTQGLFQDLMDGSKSAKDAFMDFVDSILAGIAQIVARNLTEQLLGSFGSTDTGAGGGFLGDLLGAFFQKRATGGTVYPGKAYLVGEQGPELVVPNAMGNVMSADKTSAMMRRGGTNVTFVLPGRNDLRTEQQRQADLARATSRQLSRATA